MAFSFDLLDYPVVFRQPRRLTKHSSWHEHIPFGMLLVALLRPRLLVELGAAYGDSYCAFCQAVQESASETRCCAVDSWTGNPDSGRCGPEALAELRDHHDPIYSAFSSLVQNSFAGALGQFGDGEIDLLHIDGATTYEAVRDDFKRWLPKMSRRGVILLHGTTVRNGDRGVKRLFDEARSKYRCFEFPHASGLGLIVVGGETPEILEWLLDAQGEERAQIRELFHTLGRVVALNAPMDIQEGKLGPGPTTKEYEHVLLRLKVEELVTARLQNKLVEKDRQLTAFHNQIEAIAQSRGWSLLQLVWGVKRRLLGRAQELPSALAESDGSQTHVGDDKSPLPDNHEPLVEQNPIVEVLPALTMQNQITLANQPLNDVRLIAYYLPQFHPIPENNLWWGKGFTEWSNVTKAKPNFDGHYQPHLPSDLGFYDLRLSETREQQAEMAREYGIHGFCYHHYWFGGKRLLQRPFDEVLESGKPDFPFCLCWANENWTRRWDGAEHELLIAQNHSDEDDRNFIRSIFPAFRDRRYIRVNGKPLLVVYRIGILPDAVRTAEIWREECLKSGIGEIYLCAAQSFGLTGDPRSYGFDAAVEFPPHGLILEDKKQRTQNVRPGFQGLIFDYFEAATHLINKLPTSYVLFKTVMPSWDNTPRRQHRGHVFHGANPEMYEYWLTKVIEMTMARNRGDERLIFINAWNEWGEGAHLEPDHKYGHEFLAATRRALGTEPLVGTPHKIQALAG